MLFKWVGVVTWCVPLALHVALFSPTPALGQVGAELSDLSGIGWRMLASGDSFGPWDIVWTREGRVEFEMIEEGPERLTDETTSVRGPDGKFTLRWRLAEQSVFAMHPRFFRRARVDVVTGDVLVSTDPVRAREFVLKHGVVIGSSVRAR